MVSEHWNRKSHGAVVADDEDDVALQTFALGGQLAEVDAAGPVGRDRRSPSAGSHRHSRSRSGPTSGSGWTLPGERAQTLHDAGPLCRRNSPSRYMSITNGDAGFVLTMIRSVSPARRLVREQYPSIRGSDTASSDRCGRFQPPVGRAGLLVLGTNQVGPAGCRSEGPRQRIEQPGQPGAGRSLEDPATVQRGMFRGGRHVFFPVEEVAFSR